MHPRFDRSGGRVLAAVLSAFALAITGSMATAAPTLAAASTLFADLSMDNVDPPPEEAASGSGTVTIDPAAGSICWDIIVSTTSETPTIELREGATGVNGSVVFDLGMLTGEAQAADCLAGQSESTLDAIVASPASYYILVSTETTPTGVLRAQLQPFVPMATASIITRLCPKAIQTVAQFDASVGGCPDRHADGGGDELAHPRERFGQGRRILKIALLHHHFEKSGWRETQVVVRFWIITMLLCLVGLSTLKLR